MNTGAGVGVEIHFKMSTLRREKKESLVASTGAVSILCAAWSSAQGKMRGKLLEKIWRLGQSSVV